MERHAEWADTDLPQLSDELFGAVVEQAAVGIVLYTFDRHIIRANAAYERLIGYSEAELRVLTFPASTHPDDAEADRALFTALVAGERDHYQIEKRYRCKDGGIVWGRLTISLVRDEAGQPRAILGMIEDITARMTAVQALYAGELRYRAVVEQAAEGIFFFNAVTKRIIGANPAFLRLLGYTAEEIAALTLYDIIAQDRASIDANTAQIAAEGRNAIGDRRYRRKDGTVVTVEVSATTLEPSSNPTFCVVVRDVTERRAMEAALRTSEADLRTREAQLRSVTENVPLILFTLNADGVVVFAAGSGLDALGLTPARVIGRALFATNSATEIMGYVRCALDGETLTATVPIRDRLFETHYTPVREAGRIVGVGGLALDITAQAHAQAELRRLDLGLTPRERELLPMLARKELTSRQIGALLYIKPSTIRTYIEQIAEKLSVATTRKAVAAAARERGLLDAP